MVEQNAPAASVHNSPSKGGVGTESDLGLQVRRGHPFSALTDDELLRSTSEARGAAHRAPLQEWSMDHKGHSAIVNHSRAWADRGAEFNALAEECRRRKLTLPPCDCSPESHPFSRA